MDFRRLAKVNDLINHSNKISGITAIVAMILAFCFPTLLLAQTNPKLAAKLEKLLQKNDIAKCAIIAQKELDKNPLAEVPHYYLGRIAHDKYMKTNSRQFTIKWKFLKPALDHASLLHTNYQPFREEVQASCRALFAAFETDEKTAAQLKTALTYYTKQFNDTLAMYFVHFPKEIIPAAKQMDFQYFADSLRRRLVEFAQQWVGVPYKYAGEAPETGFDCSGFTRYVYRHIGFELPHNAHLQSFVDGDTLGLHEALPGDLIFFGSRTDKGWNTHHAGIYFGQDADGAKVIHCVSGGVNIDGKNSNWENYWKDRVLFVKRVILPVR